MNLDGRSVLVLRPRDQAGALADLLRQRGAEPVVVPAIEIRPPDNGAEIDAAIRDAASFEWAVFTSVNGVRIVMERVRELEVPFAPRFIGAIGPGTASALADHGYDEVWMPPVYTTEALAEELPDATGEVLLVRAQAAGTELDERLRERGMRVRRIDAYRTEEINHDAIRAALHGGVNAVLLTSASIAASFASAADGTTVPPVCAIGPATAAAARHAGLRVDAEAERHTVDGIVDALESLPEQRHGRAS